MFVDLNSDLGESFGSWKMGNDDQILPVVTSANIACGFHAGDPLGILKTLRKAVELNVTIGAHVSYPDPVGLSKPARIFKRAAKAASSCAESTRISLYIAYFLML